MLNLPAVKIVFFDIGNVFVSDDPSGCFVYRALYDRLKLTRPELTPEEFFEGRTSHVQSGGSVWSYVKSHINDPEYTDFRVATRRAMYNQWGAVSPPIQGMDAMARELAKHYKLGIIANQPAEVEGVLAERGLLDLFAILAISDKVSLHKPDPKFYEYAIAEAGVEPHETLMVGDRIDNDIKPAKSVGMQTLWLKFGIQGRGWKAGNTFEECYARSIELANWTDQEPKSEAEQPDAVAHSPEEILQLLVGAPAR